MAAGLSGSFEWVPGLAGKRFDPGGGEYLRRGDSIKAIELLDTGLEKFPTWQIRYTEANTLPFIEGYYMASEYQKGDKLLMDYARNLMQYIDYYLEFEGIQGDMVLQTLFRKMDELDMLYHTTVYFRRSDVLRELNEYYRTLGAYEEELVQPEQLTLLEDSLQQAN